MKFTGFQRAVILTGVALCAAIPALAQSDASKTDRYFVAAILQTSNAEIQTGNLAQQKSPSPDVKRFAQRMIGDHTQLTQQMRPLAQRMTITVAPDAVTPREQKASTKLQELSGDAFDKEYIRTQLDEQSHALRLFQSEIATTHDENLKQTARSGAKTTMVHVHMAEQLAAAHHVGVSVGVRRPGPTPGPVKTLGPTPPPARQ
jgi:putative membrane protein